MSEKIVVQLNKEAADVELEAAAARREKLRKIFENKSNWPIIIKGPVGTLIYGMFTYPRVFFDHIIMENPLYSLTIYQETLVRTIKWSMSYSSLKTMRKSGSFAESLIKTFRCSEPFRSLKATEMGGIKGYWLGPKNYKQKESEATILYVHGGGYVALSSLIGIRSLCYMLKNLRKRYNKHIRVLAIEYPLAPEEPFPTGLNYVERTYKWLVNSGIAGSKNVFLYGDSAGAGLVLALLQKLYPAKSNVTLPLGVILLSPWVELSCDSTSYFTNAEFDWITEDYAQLAAEYYIFGKGGNPTREGNQISQQPKIDKEIIMDWLEKVEDNFDLNQLSKRLSNYSFSSNKRNSGFRARKRGSKSAKRRSRDKKTIAQTHDPDETFHIESEHPISDEFKLQPSSIKEEIKDKTLHTVNITSVTEENPYRDPLISPLHIPHHILAKFPPLFISYGGKEIFRDDIEMFAQKCIESKKAFTSFKINDDKFDNSLDGQHPDVIVETDEDMIHDYPLLIDVFGKRSKKALDRIIHFIANRMPTIPTTTTMSNSPLRARSKDSLKVRKVRSQPQFSTEFVKHSTLSDHSGTNSSRVSDTIPNSRRIPSSIH